MALTEYITKVVDLQWRLMFDQTRMLHLHCGSIHGPSQAKNAYVHYWDCVHSTDFASSFCVTSQTLGRDNHAVLEQKYRDHGRIYSRSTSLLSLLMARH